MTDFHIKPKVYKSKQEKTVNTYQEAKQTVTEKNKRWREFVELRLRKMGLIKIR